MSAQRILKNCLVYGVASLFVMTLVPEKARGFQPQPEAPGRQLSSPQQQPALQQAPSQQPSVQPQVGHTGPRLPAAPGPGPGAVLPHFKTKVATPGPGETKGFDVFVPSESGKMLPPGSEKMGVEPNPYVPAGEAKGAEPLDEMPSPGSPSGSEAMYGGGGDPRKPAEFKGQ